MKKKDIQELRNKGEAEMTRLIHEGADRLRALRFDLAAGKVKNVAELREVKRKIARLKTFLKETAANALKK